MTTKITINKATVIPDSNGADFIYLHSDELPIGFKIYTAVGAGRGLMYLEEKFPGLPYEVKLQEPK